MNAIEAIIYCLGFIDEIDYDGEYHSQRAYDVNNESHWIAWDKAHGGNAVPRLCSSSPTPFTKNLEPYRT